MIFLIFIGADMLNAALALSQMPTHLSEWVTSLEWSPLLIVGCIIALYIVLGFFMDELSAVILTIPVIFPAVMSLDLWGLDYSDKAIWFGILVLIVMQMGLVTPPVGLNMYIINNLARDIPILETFKGVIPFLVSDLMRIVLLFIFPSITLWLVHAVGT
jgi:C4-dicarboxylate transporter DctM subunit